MQAFSICISSMLDPPVHRRSDLRNKRYSIGALPARSVHFHRGIVEPRSCLQGRFRSRSNGVHQIFATCPKPGPTIFREAASCSMYN
jgi:hypothetical protein